MPRSHRPQRLLAALAVVGIAAGGLMALPGTARADGETSRAGGCGPDEGQTIIIDWNDPADPTNQVYNIVRCIFLEDGDTYPVDPDNKLGAPLASAGLEYSPKVGVITTIEGITAGPGENWIYVLGEVENWKTEWEPQPVVDSFVGVTLSASKANAQPIPVPKFNMPPFAEPPKKPDPTTEEPTEDPTTEEPTKDPTTEEPTKDPTTEESTKKPTKKPTSSPSTPPSQTSPQTATPTATATSSRPAPQTSRPNRTRRPTTRPPRQTTRPQRPTYRPQQPNFDPQPPNFGPPPPNFPQPPPVQEQPLPPPVFEEPIETALPADPSGEGTGPANAPPSRVWGREDVTRQSAQASDSDNPAPWSQLAAVAGAVVVVGGLGTAFARGLQTSTPPVVEEE